MAKVFIVMQIFFEFTLIWMLLGVSKFKPDLERIAASEWLWFGVSVIWQQFSFNSQILGGHNSETPESIWIFEIQILIFTQSAPNRKTANKRLLEGRRLDWLWDYGVIWTIFQNGPVLQTSKVSPSLKNCFANEFFRMKILHWNHVELCSP